MKNKIIWLGALIGFILGFISLLNLNNLIGYLLLYPFLVFYLVFYNLLMGPCSGNLCDERLSPLVPFIIFIPIIYLLLGSFIGALIGFVISKIKS